MCEADSPAYTMREAYRLVVLFITKGGCIPGRVSPVGLLKASNFCRRPTPAVSLSMLSDSAIILDQCVVPPYFVDKVRVVSLLLMALAIGGGMGIPSSSASTDYLNIASPARANATTGSAVAIREVYQLVDVRGFVTQHIS